MLPKFSTISNIILDEQACITFLKNSGVFYEVSACEECGGPVALYNKKFQCKQKVCQKKVSLFKNSFFSKARIPCNEVIHIGYLWLAGCSHNSIMKITGHSCPTISAYMSYFRNLVINALDNEDCLIGGPGIVVELDESKFGKRKYNRGHRVEGAWVVGGVERTDARRMFVEVVDDRSAETLNEIIIRNVRPGSIVYTDLWRGYSGLTELGFQHEVVNHSVNFVDPMTGVHTNSIEGTWNGIKFQVPPRNRTRDDISEHLLEFIWRRKNESNLWDSLIEALKIVYYK